MAPRNIINDTIDYNRKINSIRKLLKSRTYTQANWPMKPTRATPIKIMEKGNVDDGGKSIVLTKTLERHDQPKKSRVSMEKGVNLLPSVPQGDFLPKEERPPRSKPTKLPTTTLTLHPDRVNHVHNSQCQRLKKKSSDFLDKIDIYYLSSRLENIIKRKSKPKIKVAELLAFIGSVQRMNAVRPLSSDFLTLNILRYHCVDG